MTTDHFSLSHWIPHHWAVLRGAVAKTKRKEWKMKHLISYSWLFCWLFIQLEQNQKAHICHTVLFNMDPSFPVQGAQLIHTVLYVPTPWFSLMAMVTNQKANMVTNRKSAVRWMLRARRVIQKMPNVSISKSVKVRASKEILAAVHITLDRAYCRIPSLPLEK